MVTIDTTTDEIRIAAQRSEMADQEARYFERLRALEVELREKRAEIASVKAAAKNDGFNERAIAAVVKIDLMNSDQQAQREEFERERDALLVRLRILRDGGADA